MGGDRVYLVKRLALGFYFGTLPTELGLTSNEPIGRMMMIGQFLRGAMSPTMSLNTQAYLMLGAT